MFMLCSYQVNWYLSFMEFKSWNRSNQTDPKPCTIHSKATSNKPKKYRFCQKVSWVFLTLDKVKCL